ncbi:glycosyltransferase family 4 protein [Pontibacter fetidus]|uniref:Glycosyltransferase n=1 Tax=Pontibacter fetidus TaxID=2700082 RepID=A0A6B2H1W7_9BACT|nr:glycosyltransferase family 4 protein [Pontibacter fetidus]NDK56313.1 glycosyltransferase [Pontibacter fetidus]
MAKILHIIPYRNLYPPQNGGALRCFNLLKALAAEHEVDVIVFQPKVEFIKSGPFYLPENVTIYNPINNEPSSLLHRFIPDRIADAIVYRYLVRSLKGPADKTLLKIYSILSQLLDSKNYDVIIFEHLQSMMAAKYIKKKFPHAKLILDAHNVDHILLAKEAETKKQSELMLRVIRRTKKIESSLNDFIHAFVACSSKDEQILKNINMKGSLKSTVVPNGVDLDLKPYLDIKKLGNGIIFCGHLDTVANREGLLWFCNSVLPLVIEQRPDAYLTVVGQGNESKAFDTLKSKDGIVFTGRVDSVVPYYYENNVAVAPLTLGSGTRLKILEAMSLGNPVVSTTIGAEGVDYPTGTILLADEPIKFAGAILKLLEDASLAEKQRKLARAFVEDSFSWNKIGDKMNHFLKSLATNEK